VRGLYRRLDEKTAVEPQERLGQFQRTSRKRLLRVLIDARLQLGKRETWPAQGPHLQRCTP